MTDDIPANKKNQPTVDTGPVPVDNPTDNISSPFMKTVPDAFTVSDATPTPDKSTQNSPKTGIAVLAALAFVVITTPIAMYLGQQKQDNRQRAVEIDNTATEPVQTNLPQIAINKPAVTTIPTSPIKTEYQDVINKLLVWLDKQKSPTGTYYYNRLFNTANQEQELTTDNRVGVIVAGARYTYWQRTKDNQILDLLRQDLSTENNEQVVPTFQPDFWSCKLLYEMIQDPSLTTDLKTNAKGICDRAAFIAPDISKTSGLTTGSNLPVVNNINVDNFFQTNTAQPVNDKVSSAQNAFLSEAAFISDFSAKAWLSDNSQNIRIAQSLFNISANLYQGLKTSKHLANGCILGVGAVDLYQTTREQKYLVFAQKIFNENQMATDLNDQVSCILLSQELNKISSNPIYISYNQSTLNQLIQKDLDKKFGAFVNKLPDASIYDTKINALMLKILSTE